jgi:hypothetical protein
VPEEEEELLRRLLFCSPSMFVRVLRIHILTLLALPLHVARCRQLAVLEEEEELLLTPFERNLEVWRQLWRVLERSDIVVQVRQWLDNYSTTSYLS